LKGTPVRVEFRTTENPFAGRRNKLTPRQAKHRKRMLRFKHKNKS
jgi:GTP-binding protein